MPFVETSGKRILFVHIPKTGGTSIEKAMEAVAPLRLCARTIPGFMKVPPEHLTAQDLYGLFGDGFFDYRFAIVRNPYARLESEYRLRALLARDRSAYNSLPAFPIWLEQVLDNARRDASFLANHLRPQVDFLSAGMRVFRYEQSLEAIVDKVNEEAGAGLQLPTQRHLSTAEVDVSIEWSGNSVNLVNQFYHHDFEALGYEKRGLNVQMG